MRTPTLLISAFAVVGAVALGQAPQNFDNVQVHSIPAQGNVYMLVGAGGNVTAQVGKDGVLLVDTMYAPLAQKILAELKTINPGPLRYIIDTHVHDDHIGGNEPLRKAGSTIAGGNVSGDLGAAAGEGAAVIAHEATANRMSAPTGKTSPVPVGAWPTSTFFDDEKKIFFNGEGIEIIHMPNAHTDGDVVVFFRRSDVIATGDLFTTTNYPVFDLDRGGSYQGVIDAVNRILDLVIPVYGQEGGTMIIPGHGRLCDAGDLLNYREMATIIRDRIVDMIKKGMTLEQVKAARPTQDYDTLYGSGGFWTTDQFVEAAYKSLTQTLKTVKK